MEKSKRLMYGLCFFVIFTLINSLALADDARVVQVDPPDRLMNKMVWGEWATAGNLDGWSGSNISGLSSTGGYITGTGTASNPSIQKTGISEPDLDFGYYDFLQIRIKVPASFNDDIIFSFGTTVNGGFASNREFRIPDANIPKDGDWHTYRLDLGLVMWWRDSLTDLQIKPLGNSGSGQTFYVDYVEVGDLPGDVLLVNSSDLNIYAGETLADCSKMESKHATFWWSPQSFVEFAAFDPTVMGRRALRMIEESYQVYCKKLGYQEPFESWKIALRDGNRYKTNHITWYSGFWMGGTERFGYIGVSGGGLGDEGWGNPVPHEFGHVVDGHQINFLTGGHWESHANYLRQAWQLHYAERFPSNQQAQLDLQIYELSNYRQDHGRLIYRDFRIHQAIQDYADDLGLDDNLVAQLWFEGTKEYTVYNKLKFLIPESYNVGDVVAFGLRHWPFLDFADGDKFKNQLWSTSDNKAWHDYVTGSLLIPSQDRPGRWRVPFERAPERFAYMYHELDPIDVNVTVEFQGFDLVGSDEDWRWSLAAIDTGGNVRFSDVWTAGIHSMLLNPGETKVYIVVVATPTDTSLNLEYTDNRIPPDKHYDRLHYAYEVRIVGATPAKRQLGWNTASGHYHPNGGGWVSNSATVHSTAYVGPNARVLGSAKVYDNARIEDYAIIAENATVRDNAVVSGYAVVKNNATVRNNAKVRDRAIIPDNCIVEGNGLVEDYAHLYGTTKITDSAIARGDCMPWEGTISNTAILDYDYSMAETLSDGVQFSHVPWGGWYVPYYVQTKAKPRGLVASYRIEETEGQICWDEFGAQHAILRGSPKRVSDANMNSKVLRLDGTDDYMVLDRSLCDAKEATYALWCKPNGANTNKPLLFMGSSTDTYFKLIPRDESGYAKVIYSYEGFPIQVVSTSVIPIDEWTHLAVVFNSDTSCALHINGVLDGQEWMLPPDMLLGSNDYTQAEGLYVGRDWDGNLFAGDIEDARFYNVALSADEIANEIRRSGDIIGVFYYNSPQDFDGSTTEVQSGVHNGLERVLEASIYPDTSDDVGYYEAVLDCTDERGGGFEGTGFGLDNSEILVRLENVGFWRTGIYVTLGQWQKITVGFNGAFAELYVDDQLKASRTYTATENSVAGKNYRIGFAMDTGSNKYYFDGRIKHVFIYDRFNLGDNQPPTPNPATWASVPEALTGTQITMTATTGTDASGVVEYYFDETSGNPGGTDSGWQTEATYKDTGLESGNEYEYTVKMRDKYGNETDVSVAGKAKTPSPGDFNKDGVVDANDLEILLKDWLVEYVPANPGLVGCWAFDEQSGTTAYDSIGENHGTIYGGAVLDGSGSLSFDGSNDYVELPIGSLISTLTNSTFAVWVDFSNLGGGWQRIFDFGSGTAINMFLTPRTGTDGPMRFAIKALGGGEQQATAPSTLPSGMRHVAVTIDADNDMIILYLDGSPVATNPGATYTPSDMGVTTQNWLGKSQYGADAYFSGSIDEFDIFNYTLSSAEIENLASGILPVEAREIDMYFDGIINFKDVAVFADYWLK